MTRELASDIIFELFSSMDYVTISVNMRAESELMRQMLLVQD